MSINRDLCIGCPMDGIYEPLEARGPEDAKYLIVTDTPSQASARDDRLMTKHQTQVLATKLEEAGFVREDFRFTPACHCAFDPDAHVTKVKSAALKQCRQHMLHEIETHTLEAIIPLGAAATSQAFGKTTKITKVRGMVTQSEELGIPIFPLMSPALIVMYPQNEPVFNADIASLARSVNAGYDVAAAASQQLGEYEIVEDLQFLIDMNPEVLAFDTENTGLRWYQTGTNVRNYKPKLHEGRAFFQPRFQILTMQFTVEEGKGYMLVWDHPENPIPEERKPKLRNQLRQLLCNPETIVVAQGAKYDNVALWMTEGIRFKIGGDTLMLATLLDENMPEKNLDILTKIHVPEMGGYADVFNATHNKSRMWEVPLRDLSGYGVGDADATFRLYHKLEALVMEDEKLWAHYCNVTIPGLNAFAAMETRGMFIDEGNAMAEFKEMMITDVARMESELLDAIPKACKQGIVADFLGKTNNKGQLVNKSKTAADALSFSRPDFLKEVLFNHPRGFRLTPKVFTKTTSKLKDESLREPSTSAKDHLPYFFDECPFTMQLAEYQQDSHLLNTNVVKFEENYIRGGKVRPQYHLHKAVTGRCLTGCTLVTVLDPRGQVPIKDIKRGDWVWSFDAKRKPKPAMVSWSGKTKDSEVIEVTYMTQGSRKLKTIRCTDDHHFRLRNGEYTPAGKLKGGDRLLSLESAVTASGYRRVHYTGGHEVMEHILVHTSLHGPTYGSNVVHHENECKTDNRPLNLTELTRDEHAEEHAWTPAKVAKMLETRENKSPSVEVRPDFSGKNNPRYYDIDPAWATQVLHEAGGKPSVFRDKYGMDYSCVMRKLEQHGIDWKAIREQYNTRGQRISAELIEEARMCNTMGAASRVLGVNFYKAKELLAFDGNHMVVGVRKLKGVVAVYDIEVPGNHNFIANGVCVHNSSSSEPNGQNYPKRGARAKTYREMFVPPPGHFVIENDLSQAELRIAACMSNDRTMIDIYKNGGDIHKATALIVAGVTLAQFEALPRKEQKELRQKAKAVNFGFLYGMGWRKFIVYAKTSYDSVFTEAEAKRVRTGFFTKYRSLTAWHDAMRSFAQQNKYVRSFSGRVRHLPMIDSTEEYIQQEAGRQSINSPVQEFGSSLGVMALGRANEEIDPRALQIVGFIHDAIVAYVPYEYLDWGMKTLKRYMQTNPLLEWFGVDLKVPIIADASFGLNLGEVHECDGFSLDAPFDYTSLVDKEGNLLIEVPPQRIPPNNGMLTRSAYTTADDLEDETIIARPTRVRMVRAGASATVEKRMTRSSKQMVINRRNKAAKHAEQQAVRIGLVVRRTRPT